MESVPVIISGETLIHFYSEFLHTEIQVFRFYYVQLPKHLPTAAQVNIHLRLVRGPCARKVILPGCLGGDLWTPGGPLLPC